MSDGAGSPCAPIPPLGRISRWRPRLAALALLVFLALGAPAAWAGDRSEVKARGKLVMLTYPVQGGFFDSANLDLMRERGLKLGELRKPEEFKGADVELMKGFARSLGVQLEIHAVVDGFGSLLPSLLQGEGDLVASELTITPQRLDMADFSRPYVRNWVAVVVRKESPIAAPADLASKKGAVLVGSSHVEFLEKVAPGVTFQPTGFDLESLEAVESGEADFTLLDTRVPPGQTVDANHPELKVAFRLHEIRDGIAVRKGSDLLAPLNAYLEGLEKSGELERILERNGFQ